MSKYYRNFFVKAGFRHYLYRAVGAGRPVTIGVSMFSSRFHWDPRPNRVTLALAARRAAGVRTLDLTESNPTHAGLRYPEEIAAAFAGPRMLEYEPNPAGSLAAREAVSAYYSARGQAVSPADILLTASTSEGYAYLFKLLADPGDRGAGAAAVVPAVRVSGGRWRSVAVRQYPLEYHGGVVDRRGRAGRGDHAADARDRSGEPE